MPGAIFLSSFLFLFLAAIYRCKENPSVEGSQRKRFDVFWPGIGLTIVGGGLITPIVVWVAHWIVFWLAIGWVVIAIICRCNSVRKSRYLLLSLAFCVACYAYEFLDFRHTHHQRLEKLAKLTQPLANRLAYESTNAGSNAPQSIENTTVLETHLRHVESNLEKRDQYYGGRSRALAGLNFIHERLCCFSRVLT